ncbi:MAG: DNA-processing protein DprA [Cyanobacteria bacterium J06639_1]
MALTPRSAARPLASSPSAISNSPRPSASDRPFWLAWPRVKGVGAHRLKQIYLHFGSLAAAWQADREALLTVDGIGLKVAEAIATQRSQIDPDDILEAIANRESANDDTANVRAFTPADPDYPALLWEIPDPPPVLYAKGRPVDLEAPNIAIVGTRSPTEYGYRWTRSLAKALAESGLTVVSGMALGVDGAAHRSALDAGGLTVAVVGTGVDVVYPRQHRELCDRIQTQGAILSEFLPGTPPARENFPRRNRIVAGMCRTTLTIEAPEKSGALITAYLANDYNRDVYALPGNIDTPQARGCLKLIQRGAGLILGVDELLEAIGASRSPQQQSLFDVTPTPPQPELADADQAAIWKSLEDSNPVTFDRLSDLTQLEAAQLSSALLMMELSDLVVQLPGMRYQKSENFR